MEATKEQIKRLRVDALYGKKKHFNAADRKASLNNWLTIPVALINAILSTVLVSNFQEIDPNLFKWVAASISLVATVLSTLAVLMKFAKKVEGHRRVGNKYLAIMKRCERILAYDKDGLADQASIIKMFEETSSTIEEVNREASSFSTSKKDYYDAQASIKNGDEDYLPQELN